MKTILVPVGGGGADAAALETARTVAQVTAAHVRFVHVRLGAEDAALHMPHVSFAIGPGVRSALQMLNKAGARRVTVAAQSVSDFCAASGIIYAQTPGSTQSPTAQWLIEDGNVIRRLLFHARHSDLVVMGCPTHSNDCVERMLLQSGRPLLVVPRYRPLRSLAKVIIFWRETAEAARAVSAALPLLMAADRVKAVSVTENSAADDGLRELIAYLAWHGLSAESEAMTRGDRATQDVLLSAAKDSRSDLVIMGGYGHAHVREVLFGGCTQAMLNNNELPVLFMH
jgi:nucleotide-binding universal stress UspA family protein